LGKPLPAVWFDELYVTRPFSRAYGIQASPIFLDAVLWKHTTVHAFTRPFPGCKVIAHKQLPAAM
jgi:hypothetical protein